MKKSSRIEGRCLIEFSITLTVYFILSHSIFNFLYEKQSDPFIDEIFHIPQGLKYCHGNFSEWDPKITTLPGLYFISFGVLQTAGWITSSNTCNLYNLKLINVICSSVVLCLLYSILSVYYVPKRIRASSKDSVPQHNRMAIWTAFNIALFPVSFLFNFFYYTETLSTLFILLMYRLHLSKYYWCAGAIGFGSVLIRQTNIIWVGYFFLIMAYPQLKFRTSDFTSFKKLTQLLLRRAWLELLYQGAGYLLVCFLFVIFVFVNGGIVLGDKTAHKPALHVCQLFYFSLFTLFFAFPHFLFKPKRYFQFVKSRFIITIIALLVGGLIVYNFTMVHPYLLADNRHYSFYVWRRLYDKSEILRFLLLPVYHFGFYCIQNALRKEAQLAFWLCCVICLVPQKLLEFRYFILPFILLRIQLRCETKWVLTLESLFFCFVNCLTFYIFVTKEFYWTDSKEIQRIIW